MHLSELDLNDIVNVDTVSDTAQAVFRRLTNGYLPNIIFDPVMKADLQTPAKGSWKQIRLGAPQGIEPRSPDFRSSVLTTALWHPGTLYTISNCVLQSSLLASVQEM